MPVYTTCHRCGSALERHLTLSPRAARAWVHLAAAAAAATASVLMPVCSKAAWGKLIEGGKKLHIAHYEVSVLLLPSLEAAYRRSRWYCFSCTPGPRTRGEGSSSSGGGWGSRGGGGDSGNGAGVPASNDAALPGSRLGAGSASRNSRGAVAAGEPRGADLVAAGQAGAATAADAPAGGSPELRVQFVAWQRGSRQAPSRQAEAQAQLLRLPLPVPYRLPPRPYPPVSAGGGAWLFPWTSEPPDLGQDALGLSLADSLRGDSSLFGLTEDEEWEDIVQHKLGHGGSARCQSPGGGR